MLRAIVFLILMALGFAQKSFAQKKPITLESLNEGGRGGRGGGAATWAPDGKTFLFRQGRALMIYDPAAKSSRELVATDAMDALAVKGPAEDGPVDWANRPAGAARGPASASRPGVPVPCRRGRV